MLVSLKTSILRGLPTQFWLSIESMSGAARTSAEKDKISFIIENLPFRVPKGFAIRGGLV